MEYDNIKYNQLLVNILQAFVDFCNQHQLRYFMAYGSAIGAVRHHGIIPWDDDIDVHMPREDYKRLLTLQKEIPTPYTLLNWDQPNYTIPFAKWAHTESTIWEVEEVHNVWGLYIDIFPLDNVAKPEEALVFKSKMDRYTYLCRHANHEWSISQAKQAIREGRIKDVLTILRDTYYFKRHRAEYNSELKTHVQTFVNQQPTSGDYTISTCGVYGKKELFQKAWFEDCIRTKFEGIDVSIPIGYDAYLKQLYGDYMQLPPESARISHHMKYFIDLEHGYSFDETKQLLQ